MRKRVYLSGPISGTDNYVERFAKAEHRVRSFFEEADGMPIVMNPVDISICCPFLRWDEYMKIDEVVLSSCDTVVLLPGWADSEGSRQEFQWAKEKGKMVYLIDEKLEWPELEVITYWRE